MQQKTSILKTALSWITYQKTKQIKPFVIPEASPQTSQMALQQRGSAENSAVREVSSQERALDPHKQWQEIKSEQAKRQQSTLKDPATSDSKPAIPSSYEATVALLKNAFHSPVNADFVIREFFIGNHQRAFITYMEGMADRNTVNQSILRPLMNQRNTDTHPVSLEYIQGHVLETNQTKQLCLLKDVISSILVGDTGVYVEGHDCLIFSETKGFDRRGVEKPVTEGVVKGSQEGFNESLRTNITLIRKIIKNQHLTTEFLNIGQRNHNLCAVMYLDDLANPAIVTEVKRRINSLNTDYIAGSGMLEQFIEDSPWSFLPTVLSTERPDRTASHIMEGRVAIITEGTPTAIVVPVSFVSLFHSPEDYAIKWQVASMVRLLRIFAFFISMLLPGLYVALTAFHREMIPTDLLIAIAKAKENVPFPTILEVIFMEFGFELIREAGIRIPGIIGSTIGIIGGLILGQAAVSANLASPVLIIVIAITGLCNFSMPDFNLALGVRIMRILFIFVGAFVGFYGITLLLIGFLGLMLSINSFGVGLFAPIAPYTRGSPDQIIRQPIFQQELRPDDLNPLDNRRQGDIARPWTQEDAVSTHPYDRAAEETNSHMSPTKKGGSQT